MGSGLAFWSDSSAHTVFENYKWSFPRARDVAALKNDTHYGIRYPLLGACSAALCVEPCVPSLVGRIQIEDIEYIT